MSPLTPLFEPKSIAVFGASPKAQKLGHILFKNLLDYHFKGDLYPINSKGAEVLGHQGYRSILDVPTEPDLALISIPGPFVYPVLEDCATKGVKGAIILSSGFGEMGGEGRKWQDKIKALSIETGLRIIGPNCMGLYNLSHQMNGTYFWKLPRKKGPLAFISQSGAYGGIFFHELEKRNLSLSKFISIGNMLDVDHADLIQYLKNDDETKIIALFVEEIRDGQKFIQALHGLNKPVICLKAGRTKAGQRAALSHTGSMAGSYQVFEGVCKQYGVLLADGTDDFFDTIKAFFYHRNHFPKSHRTCVLTISGGPSVIASDTAESVGMELPELDSETQQELALLLPPFSALSNPVDMTPQINRANYEEVVDKILSLDYIDSAMAINCGLDSAEFGQAFAKAHQKYQKPIHGYSIDNEKIEKIFKEEGIPLFATPDRCALSLKKLADYGKFQNRVAEPSRKIQPSSVLPKLIERGSTTIDEVTARLILAEYGLPMVPEIPFRDKEEEQKALEFAEKIKYPVVLKIFSPEVVHKTEEGGVIPSIPNEEGLRSAIKTLRKKFGNSAQLLLQKMIHRGVELILGGKRDPAFGPVLLVGMGGIFTEIYRDISMGVCPLDRGRALEMLVELKGFPMLQGFRNLPAVDLDNLADLVVATSDFMAGNPQVKELDINPLIINRDGAFVVDTVMAI